MEVLKVTPSSPVSLRRSLREATGQTHSRLDAMFDAMLEGGDRRLYERFIMMNHAGHEAIEPILLDSPLPGLVPDWPARSRLAALRLDMAEMQLRRLDLPAFGLAKPDLPQAVGIAYVVEGSRLGATLIGRRLPASPKDGTGDTSRHYLEESAGAGEFRSFMDIVSALDWDQPSLARAAGAAEATFDYFLLAALRTGHAA